MMKKLFMTAILIAASIGLTNAQTAQKQIVEEGGTGPFKSEVVGDASCPGFTVYRPQNLKEVVAKQGALPVIVYANGACFNNNVEMRLLLSEVASRTGLEERQEEQETARGSTLPDLSQDAAGGFGLADRSECQCRL